MVAKINGELVDIQERYNISASALLIEILNTLLSYKEIFGITFVHGSGKRKTKRYGRDIYRIDNMAYDEQSDSYTCPGGKRQNYTYDSHRKSDNGYVTVTKNYVCESCFGCPYREKCFKCQYENLKVSISQTYVRQKRTAEELITTDEGNLLLMNRSIQVEGAFGVLKQDFAFRRFLTRGKKKTETQFFLLAIAYNLQKFCNRISFGRFNRSLSQKRTVLTALGVYTHFGQMIA